MIRWRRRNQRLTYLLIDCLSILVVYQIAGNFYKEAAHQALQMNPLEEIGLLVLINVCFIGMFIATKLYDESILEDDFFSLNVQAKTVTAFILAAGLCVSLMFWMHVTVPWLFMLFFVMGYYGFYILSKVLLLKDSKDDAGRNKGDRRILIVGVAPNGKRYIDEIDSVAHLSLKIVGYVEITDSEGYEGLPRLGGILDLDRVVQAYHVDEIAVVEPLNSYPGLEVVLNECQQMGITISMLLTCHSETGTKVHATMVGGVPVLKFHTVSLNEDQLFIKRTLDVFGSILGMVFFGIALLIFAPFIILETPGPVILKQERVGKNGRVFEIWRFRTTGVYPSTRRASETADIPRVFDSEPQLTKIGVILQKSGIDRLPQIYNVLRGDLSLVGTEPSTPQEVQSYQHHHRKRLSMTPGLTGVWKINGGSARNDVEERVRQDSEYIANWTVWTDISILLRTFQESFDPLRKTGSSNV